MSKKELTGEYQKWRLEIEGLIITRFKNKILVQGKETDESLNLIKRLFNLDSLFLNRKNSQKFMQLFGYSHNAIVCTECYNAPMIIEGTIENSKVVF